jgi:hypothetical protein
MPSSQASENLPGDPISPGCPQDPGDLKSQPKPGGAVYLRMAATDSFMLPQSHGPGAPLRQIPLPRESIRYLSRKID